ncbi:UNVERIFIED_CONTAM: hypothetical protein PYX00_006741 [Menopon gallinae]|uniref:Uncharacterized protein n=1 Tax=Menopon gallinae TaxID=328185 RepID=A0AAW2HXB5_9NEOP
MRNRRSWRESKPPETTGNSSRYGKMTLLWLLFAVLSVGHGFIHPSNLECDFESPCNWKWNMTIPNGFRLTAGEDVEAAAPRAYAGPAVDATNSTKGKLQL